MYFHIAVCECCGRGWTQSKARLVSMIVSKLNHSCLSLQRHSVAGSNLKAPNRWDVKLLFGILMILMSLCSSAQIISSVNLIGIDCFSLVPLVDLQPTRNNDKYENTEIKKDIWTYKPFLPLFLCIYTCNYLFMLRVFSSISLTMIATYPVGVSALSTAATVWRQWKRRGSLFWKGAERYCFPSSDHIPSPRKLCLVLPSDLCWNLPDMPEDLLNHPKKRIKERKLQKGRR